MSVVCVDPWTPVVGGVILCGLCHVDVHVDNVSLVSGSVLVGHKGLPFCGADSLTPKEFERWILLT